MMEKYMGLPCTGEWREGLVYHGEIIGITLPR